MSRALVIVDPQVDFVEGGALAVTGGRVITEKIAQYVEDHGPQYAVLAVTQDWHRPNSDNGGHFSPRPDYHDTWPVHCVADTPGADFVPVIKRMLDETWIFNATFQKGYGSASYSGFDGGRQNPDTGRFEGLSDCLSSRGVTEIDVVGLAADFCVAYTAMDGIKHGYIVRVIPDLTVGILDSGQKVADEVAAKQGLLM